MLSKVRKSIPYGHQSISEQDIEAVVRVLRSDWLTQGSEVPQFESAIVRACGVKHATAVSNATAALHLCCLALEMTQADRLWTSPITFVASANCGLYCGSQVDFVDINPDSLNIDCDALSEKLAVASKNNALPKVLVVVHFAGLPCDMARIYTLAKQYGVQIIEDASHAIGARYKDTTIGDCRYSDLTVFSFHPVKLITTGEGGMITTNSPELHSKVQRLRSHGITRNPEEMPHGSEGEWYYNQIDLGFNYRLTDVQAALGTSQLKRLDEFVTKRNEIADVYKEKLSSLPLKFQKLPEDVRSAYHLFVIEQQRPIVAPRSEVVARLRHAGIGANVHYIPVHLQPYYQSMGFKRGQFPNAENYYETAVSLPIYPDLTPIEQEYVVDQLYQIFKV